MAQLMAPSRATGHAMEGRGIVDTGFISSQATETGPRVGPWLNHNGRITFPPTVATNLAESDHDNDSDASSKTGSHSPIKPAGHLLDVSIDKSPVYDGPADLQDHLQTPARISNYSSVASFDSTQYQHRVPVARKPASLDLTWFQRESEQSSTPLFAETGIAGTGYHARKRKHAVALDADEASCPKSGDNPDREPKLLDSPVKQVAAEHQDDRQMANVPWGGASRAARRAVGAHRRGWQRRSSNGSIGRARFKMVTSTPTNVQSTPKVFYKHRLAGHGSAPPKVTFARSPKFYIPDDGASQSVCSAQDVLCDDDDDDGNLRKLPPRRADEVDRNKPFPLLWFNIKRPVTSTQTLQEGVSGRELSVVIGWMIMSRREPKCNNPQPAVSEPEDVWYISLALPWVLLRAVVLGEALLQRVLGRRISSTVHALWRSLLWSVMALIVWLLGKLRLPVRVKTASRGGYLPTSA